MALKAPCFIFEFNIKCIPLSFNFLSEAEKWDNKNWEKFRGKDNSLFSKRQFVSACSMVILLIFVQFSGKDFVLLLAVSGGGMGK